jgi:hypothetical protein
MKFLVKNMTPKIYHRMKPNFRLWPALATRSGTNAIQAIQAKSYLGKAESSKTAERMDAQTGIRGAKNRVLNTSLAPFRNAYR